METEAKTEAATEPVPATGRAYGMKEAPPDKAAMALEILRRVQAESQQRNEPKTKTFSFLKRKAKTGTHKSAFLIMNDIVDNTPCNCAIVRKRNGSEQKGGEQPCIGLSQH